MNFADYKEKMKERLIRYFDIEEDFKYKDYIFDLYGIYNLRNEKYLASKKLTIYAFENNEYIFLKHYPEINVFVLDGFIEILKESIDDFITPHDEHMSSTITGLLAVDSLDDEELIKKIKKFKFQKSFLFGLKGWVDIRLIIVDLNKEILITCKKGKKSVKFFQP